MALLISNGIRKDTVAIVNVRGKWIIAPGDKLRHLRPDADTSEGWVKAVLRGRPLGAVVMDHLIEAGNVILLHHHGGGRAGNLSRLFDLSLPLALCYTNSLAACPLIPKIVIDVPGWEIWRTVIIANIVLDNIERGGLC